MIDVVSVLGALTVLSLFMFISALWLQARELDKQQPPSVALPPLPQVSVSLQRPSEAT